jgi:SAM-dependent methyltransferase
LIELLPKAASIDRSFWQRYADSHAEEFNKPFVWDKAAMAWGAPERRTPRWVGRRKRQVRWIESLLTQSPPVPDVFCDILGGAGYYTLEYAHHFRWVMHCDLSVGSLNYVHEKAQTRSIDNIVFLRIDYFRPPFNHNLALLLCCDSLIFGPVHERMLLDSIKNSLAPAGRALVDFHNWWHNPIRRVKLLKQNFPTQGSYTRKQADDFLRAAGGLEFECFPFFQEFDQRGIFGKLGAKILPPTRLAYWLRAGTRA